MNSKSSSIWGDKSLWNLSNSPNSTISMQTANGSMCSNDSNGKDLVWQSTQSSPISSSSQYNNNSNINSLWDCSPIPSTKLNDCHHDEPLGSIWMIPQSHHDANFEAPLPPPMSYSQKTQPQLLRPQEIGGSVWSGMAVSNNTNNTMNCPSGNNMNNNNNNNNNINNNNNNNKVKDTVGALWAHPTPPNLPLTLQAQNYNLLQTNNKFQPSPIIKPMGMNAMTSPPPGLLSHNNNVNYMSQQNAPNVSNACNNLQLFSDEFLSYLNMIN